MKKKGLKYDQNKLRYDLIPPLFIESMAEVLTYGAKKYSENSWQNVEIDRYYAALFRHIQAWRKGEQFDQESGIEHLKHALINIAFILYKEKEKKGEKKQ
jgi:hypothetical protein